MAGLEPATSRFGVGRPILLGHMILEFSQFRYKSYYEICKLKMTCIFPPRTMNHKSKNYEIREISQIKL